MTTGMWVAGSRSMIRLGLADTLHWKAIAGRDDPLESEAERRARSMAQHHPGGDGRMPEEVRAIGAALCRDIAALQLKWDTYLGLFASPATAALLSDTAPAFFQVVGESLRNDI